MTSLLPYIGRLIALGIAWVVTHYGIQLSDIQQQQLAEALLNIVTIFVGVYFAGHKTLDKFFNPGDTASGHLALEDKSRTNVLKSRRNLARR